MRSVGSDLLMTNRFHIIDVSVNFPTVFTPVYGFSSVTAPELSIEEREIIEGNFEYPRKVTSRATVNTITCARGTSLQDNDFYFWIFNCLEGKETKKNLMLQQLTNISPLTPGDQFLNLPTVTAGITRFPGRAWILRNCSPKRYKVASDFDANTGAISIQELEISYEFFVEFNMGLGA